MISVSILTLSDKGSQGQREDRSGPEIAEIVKTIGATVVNYEILPDEKNILREKLIALCSSSDIIFTTGGTGLTPRDITPETTLEVIEKEVPGIAEAMRLEGLKKTPYAMLSRAVAGIRALLSQ